MWIYKLFCVWQVGDGSNTTTVRANTEIVWVCVVCVHVFLHIRPHNNQMSSWKYREIREVVKVKTSEIFAKKHALEATAILDMF